MESAAFERKKKPKLSNTYPLESVMARQEEGAKVLEQALSDPDGISPSELIGRLIQANYNDYAATTQAVIDGLQFRNAELEATLGIIRQRVNELFAGDYMPTQFAIEQAVFYPSRTQIRVDTQKKLSELEESTPPTSPLMVRTGSSEIANGI